MSGLDALGPEDLAELTEVVGRLKHDLGKYVAFQIRWLAADATAEQRLDALRRDLLQTRSGPTGTVDALTVWGEFEPVLVGSEPLATGVVANLSEEPSLNRIQHHMRALGPILAAVRSGAVEENTVNDGISAALEVATACRDLQRRVRTAGGSAHG